jgi:hypothetical protein
VAYLKLFEKFYAPLTSAIIDPVAADTNMPTRQLTALDRLYSEVSGALNRLAEHVGLQAAA